MFYLAPEGGGRGVGGSVLYFNGSLNKPGTFLLDKERNCFESFKIYTP